MGTEGARAWNGDRRKAERATNTTVGSGGADRAEGMVVCLDVAVCLGMVWCAWSCVHEAVQCVPMAECPAEYGPRQCPGQTLALGSRHRDRFEGIRCMHKQTPWHANRVAR